MRRMNGRSEFEQRPKQPRVAVADYPKQVECKSAVLPYGKEGKPHPGAALARVQPADGGRAVLILLGLVLLRLYLQRYLQLWAL